jgi:predicted DNA-binding mobile mystery protein A
MRADLAAIARQALERRVAPVRPAAADLRLSGGWIGATREALGMSATQLAKRCGVSRQTAQHYERSEVDKTIQLRTLERAAEALGCRLVYAFVPDVPFDDVVLRQAVAVASSELDVVDQTMLLEDQQVEADRMARRRAERAEELVSSRRLWDSLPSSLR